MSYFSNCKPFGNEAEVGKDPSKDLRHQTNRFRLYLVDSGKLLACQKKGSGKINPWFGQIVTIL